MNGLGSIVVSKNCEIMYLRLKYRVYILLNCKEENRNKCECSYVKKLIYLPLFRMKIMSFHHIWIILYKYLSIDVVIYEILVIFLWMQPLLKFMYLMIIVLKGKITCPCILLSLGRVISLDTPNVTSIDLWFLNLLFNKIANCNNSPI